MSKAKSEFMNQSAFATKLKLFIEKYWHKKEMKVEDLNRDDFRNIMKSVGLHQISYAHATEAFIEFKGLKLEKSNTWDLNKLWMWVANNLQLLTMNNKLGPKYVKINYTHFKIILYQFSEEYNIV